MKTQRLPIFGARMISLALLSSMLCLAESTPAIVIAKFVGTWKENEAKRKIGSGLTLRFRRVANGQLEELRGPDARPLVQPVNFDGKPYNVDNSKNTLTWKQHDASHFERTISGNGNLIATRRIQISTDGKTLTEVTERKMPDGKDLVATVVYKRSSGDQQGLVGIWKLESVHTSEPGEVKYEAVGTNGLRATGRGVTQIMTLDGKPTPVTGPAVISGAMIAAKIVDDRTIETTSSREGVVTGKATLVISTDGKTLTSTFTSLGPNAGSEPGVVVYEKQ
jgi:hypothetical protein